MKKNCFLVIFLMVAFGLSAQQKLNTRLISPKFNAEKRKSTPKSTYNFNAVSTDTLNEYVAADNGGLGTVTLDYVAPYDTGWAMGSNIYGITETMQRFDLQKGGTLHDILMGFGYAVGSGTFTVNVRADNNGFPGQIIESVPLPFSAVDMFHLHTFGDSVQYMGWNCKATLPNALTFSAGTTIWVGFNVDSLVYDSVNTNELAMMSSSPGYPAPANYVYQSFQDSLYTLSTIYGSDMVLSIFPVIEYPVGQIRGTVFNDVNKNNVQDSLEAGIENIKVTVGSFINYTDVNGNYIIYTDSGNYTIQAPVQYANETPASLHVFVPDSGLSVGNNFAVQYIPNVRDLAVEIIPGPFRPGFTGDYFISITNYGTQTDSGTVDITLDDSLQYNYSIPAPDNINAHVVTLSYPPLNQGESTVLYINSNIPATIGLNDTLSCIAVINPIANDSNLNNNYDTLAHLTQGSYDPNIKSVLPAGDISPSFVANGEFLNYTIQFQNTGTDTAFNINVVDTMSSNLDVTTLEVLNSSSKCATKMYNNQVVVFAFDNILLPDSGTNEIQSHGFVSYRIKAKNNLVVGDQITNTAYIYFDFNTPVVTGTTINTVSVTTTASINNLNKTNLQTLAVYPNPFTNDVMLSFNQMGTYTIKITDVLGAVKLGTSIKNSKNYMMDLSALSSGCYFIIAEGRDGLYKTKLIKQ